MLLYLGVDFGLDDVLSGDQAPQGADASDIAAGPRGLTITGRLVHRVMTGDKSRHSIGGVGVGLAVAGEAAGDRCSFLSNKRPRRDTQAAHHERVDGQQLSEQAWMSIEERK